MLLQRTQTRKERYQEKSKVAQTLPVAIATTNFSFHENIGYLVRAAACFGAESVHVIGNMPDYDTLRRYSTGHNNFIKIQQHSNPLNFIEYCRKNDYFMVSAELDERAVSLDKVEFPDNKKTMFILGNEMNGVPLDILVASDKIAYIPLGGVGYSLNTSQTGNILLFEYARRVGHNG